MHQSLSPPLSLSSLSLSLSFSLSLFLSFSLSLFLSFSLSLFLSFSLTLFLSFSLELIVLVWNKHFVIWKERPLLGPASYCTAALLLQVPAHISLKGMGVVCVTGWPLKCHLSLYFYKKKNFTHYRFFRTFWLSTA